MTESTAPGGDRLPRRPNLVAEVVHREDGPAECTLSPADSDPERATTAWVTARGDAFLDLRDAR